LNLGQGTCDQIFFPFLEDLDRCEIPGSGLVLVKAHSALSWAAWPWRWSHYDSSKCW